VLIDHHLMPDTDFFDLLFSEIEISSTSELLFVLIHKLGFENLMDKDIANNIFIGIMTDTGSFSYSCNSPETFEHTAQLIRYGLNVKEVHDKVYNDNPEDRLRLMGFSINEKLIVKKEFSSAYISLTQNELKQFNEKPGFTEGLVNLALSVEGVQFAAMMTEKNDFIKFSFRSKGGIDVNSIAREFFNGGGHKNASGGKLYIKMEDAIQLVEKVMIERVAPLLLESKSLEIAE
jgi:phosphoesterase RecJ-like protein